MLLIPYVPEIAQAIELAEESAYTVGELDIYQSYWDNVRREKTLMLDKYVQGKTEGEAKGRAEGRIEMAKKLIQRGTPIETIIDVTGLTREKIEQIIADEKVTD